MRHARVNLSRNVIANQERPFWEINQSHCEKVIDNACSILCVMTLVMLWNKNFLLR